MHRTMSTFFISIPHTQDLFFQNEISRLNAKSDTFVPKQYDRPTVFFAYEIILVGVLSIVL